MNNKPLTIALCASLALIAAPIASADNAEAAAGPCPSTNFPTNYYCVAEQALDEIDQDIEDIIDLVTGLPVVDTALWAAYCAANPNDPDCQSLPILP